MADETNSRYAGVNPAMMQVWATKSPGDAAMFAANLTVSVGFATAAINAAVLLNGAAATAMLALIGTIWSSDDSGALQQILPSATICLKMFALGAFFAVVAGACGYMAHCHYAYSLAEIMQAEKSEILLINLDQHGEAQASAAYEANKAATFRIIGMLGFAISLFVFFIGAVNGLELLLSASKLQYPF